MKRLLRLALQLYPSWWRQRYATEFEALLEDMQPGWRAVFDVMNGAITMQIRTVGVIPVLCTLAGAIIGGVVAMRTPALYASSATIRLDARNVTTVESGRAQEPHVSLEKAFSASGTAPTATSVTLRSNDAVPTTLEVSYADRDPMAAQRGAEQLVTALATGTGGLGKSAEIVASPALPVSPIGPDYPTTIAVGGAVGLGVGGLVVALLASRRRRVSPSATAT
jgi:hypothetical protein